MKISEIRELSSAELNEKLEESKKELFNLRFQLAINQLENPMRVRAVRKDIAKIKTVLRELELKNEQ
jgi:large subunit ribosomal protein L29